MDVVLKVLEGARSGAKVSVKKAEFLIGRSKDCHLCAGSSAISRQHCLIRREGNQVFAKDLGSRNGTLVNGKKTSGEVELASGDELTVGPLKFLVTISTGIKNEKKSEVKSIAEAAERTAASKSGMLLEDDISDWLLGPDSSVSALSETQTIQLDDTNAIQLRADAAEPSGSKIRQGAKPSEEADQAADDADKAADSAVGKDSQAKSKEDDKQDGKKDRGKGKLPFRPAPPSAKDSREAAVQALRNFNRRR
jgi:pSer/pThr/pTyr-binding forkhead associated (FHA) protein